LSIAPLAIVVPALSTSISESNKFDNTLASEICLADAVPTPKVVPALAVIVDVATARIMSAFDTKSELIEPLGFVAPIMPSKAWLSALLKA
jgi:hypothetical protein